MNIPIKMNKDFERALSTIDAKYGEDSHLEHHANRTHHYILFPTILRVVYRMYYYGRSTFGRKIVMKDISCEIKIITSDSHFKNLFTD